MGTKGHHINDEIIERLEKLPAVYDDRDLEKAIAPDAWEYGYIVKDVLVRALSYDRRQLIHVKGLQKAVRNLSQTIMENRKTIQGEINKRKEAVQETEATREALKRAEFRVDTLEASLEILEVDNIVRDKNGEIIHVGQVLYGEDGKGWRVVAIAPHAHYDVIAVAESSDLTNWWQMQGHFKPLQSDWLSREQRDTWERVIQDAIDAGIKSELYYTNPNTTKLIERCKKLAGEK